MVPILSPRTIDASEQFAKHFALAGLTAFAIISILCILQWVVKDRLDNKYVNSNTLKNVAKKSLSIFLAPIIISALYWLTAIIQAYGKQIFDLLNSQAIIPFGLY